MKARTISHVTEGKRLDKTNATGFCTVGAHAHGTFKEWSEWLKAQYLVR